MSDDESGDEFESFDEYETSADLQKKKRLPMVPYNKKPLPKTPGRRKPLPVPPRRPLPPIPTIPPEKPLPQLPTFKRKKRRATLEKPDYLSPEPTSEFSEIESEYVLIIGKPVDWNRYILLEVMKYPGAEARAKKHYESGKYTSVEVIAWTQELFEGYRAAAQAYENRGTKAPREKKEVNPFDEGPPTVLTSTIESPWSGEDTRKSTSEPPTNIKRGVPVVARFFPTRPFQTAFEKATGVPQGAASFYFPWSKKTYNTNQKKAVFYFSRKYEEVTGEPKTVEVVGGVNVISPIEPPLPQGVSHFKRGNLSFNWVKPTDIPKNQATKLGFNV